MKILLQTANDYDDSAKVKGLIEMASIEFVDKKDKRYSEDELKFFQAPCIMLHEYDQKMSEQAGEATLEIKAVIPIKDSEYSLEKIRNFFKKYGIK